MSQRASCRLLGQRKRSTNRFRGRIVERVAKKGTSARRDFPRVLCKSGRRVQLRSGRVEFVQIGVLGKGGKGMAKGMPIKAWGEIEAKYRKENVGFFGLYSEPEKYTVIFLISPDTFFVKRTAPRNGFGVSPADRYRVQSRRLQKDSDSPGRLVRRVYDEVSTIAWCDDVHRKCTMTKAL